MIAVYCLLGKVRALRKAAASLKWLDREPELQRLRVGNPHVVGNPEQQPIAESASPKIAQESCSGKSLGRVVEINRPIL
jgi:hypothetical protein